MAKLPTYEEMAKRTAEIALDEYLYQGKSIREWIKIITEQELCEDAISRQAVLDAITANCIWENEYNLTSSRIKKAVESLPSVTPQPKTGQWTDDKCSKCGKGIEDLISSREWYRNEDPNFCPFCGARMETEQ